MRRILILFLTLAATAALRAQDNPADLQQLEDTTNAKTGGHMIALSDFGDEDLAYLSIPSTPPTLGILLVPDAFGLDDFTKAEADRLAGLGYITLAVDIYNGHQTADPGEMANISANLNAATVQKTIEAGIRLFHESPKYHVDHIVLMGWGVGAAHVFQESRDNKTINGAITFYGPIETHLQAVGDFAVPLCAVYPMNSPATPHADVVAFQHRMKELGNDFEAWFIDAQPGWSNPKSNTYTPIEDREAWKVALPFLVRIAATPVKKHRDGFMDKAKNSFERIFQTGPESE
jgi:carboxymethylenebutenolidase